MIPYGRQLIEDDDIQAVVEVLKSDFLTQGPAVPRFEENVARYCGVDHAVALNSATSALHVACLALGLGPGDLLWTSPVTFVASANCGLYCGAKVDFVDIDPRTGNMSVAALEKKLVQAEATGTLPKILVPVHLAGQSCNMEAVSQLAKRYGVRILEDASHAIGGKYKGEPVGNCRFSDITVFSFHPVKIITTGEGGMATTNNPDLAKRMARLRTHGITRDPADFVGLADGLTQVSSLRPQSSEFGPWYYEQLELGFNYRMTDIQAALGLSQMRKVDAFVSRRHELARRYDRMLEDLPVDTLWNDPGCYSSLHLYVVRLNLARIPKTHRQVFESLRTQGIGVNLHYIPVYRQPYYRALGFIDSDFPESENYYAEAVSLPIYAGLTEEQQDIVVDALRNALKS